MDLNKIIELASRIYVFIFLMIYGTGKLIGGQFYRRGELPIEIANSTKAEVSSFDLAWTFMGHSIYYIYFIAFAEIIGACLLLLNRTKLLGIAILLPIMINIIAFDIIFLDTYGALASAIIYTLLLFTILYLNQDRIRQIFQILIEPGLAKKESTKHNIYKLILVAILMAIVFGIDQLLVNLLGHGKG